MYTHQFSDAEGVRIAIEMEKRGENFYRRSAKLSKNRATVELLNQLADDEARHMNEFIRIADGANVSEEGYDQETNAYLSAIAADVVFPEGLMALRKDGFDSPMGALAKAIQSEKDSVLFYTELAAHAFDENARKIFGDIIAQERGHMRILQMRLEDASSEV